jgi:serine/threonine protein phosphatase PrpC
MYQALAFHAKFEYSSTRDIFPLLFRKRDWSKMDQEKRNVSSFEIAFHTDTGSMSFVEDSTIALVPNTSEGMEHIGALFLVADGWKLRDRKMLEFNCNQATVDTIRNAYERASVKPSQTQTVNITQTIIAAIKQANSLVYQMVDHVKQEGVSYGDLERLEWSVPPASCTAVTVSKQTASIAHVGSCRVYLVRQGQAKRLTEDHTVAASTVRTDLLAHRQAHTHPKHTLITRSLGAFQNIDVDLYGEAVQNGDILALCTRGFTKYVEDEELSRMIVPDKLQQSVEELIYLGRERSLADTHGDRDSITMMVVKIS